MPNYDGLSDRGSFIPHEEAEASTDGSCAPLLACVSLSIWAGGRH